MARKLRLRIPAGVPRGLANLLLLGLTLHLAVALAWATWLVLWPQNQVRPVPGPAGPGASLQDSRRALASFDVFGRPAAGQPVAENVRRNAPETRLRLRLEGVMVAEEPAQSGAIVSETGGTSAHYQVGEMLPGNAELVEVEPARILIRRQGSYESLAFDEASGGELAQEALAEASTGSAEDFVAEAQSRLDAQGVEALVEFGLRPVQDSSLQGYVFDGSNAMLRAVNLREGDVITSINGYPLGDIDQDRQLLESWRSESSLEVEVVRDGARFTVSYALPQ